MTERWPVPAPGAPVRIETQVSGDAAPGAGEYAEERVRAALDDVGRPVLHARVRLRRQADPALERPVVAQANVDVDGRFVRAEVTAATEREAADALQARLRERLRHDLARSGSGTWEDRRGRMASGEPHEWRHGDLPTQALPYFPRPVDEREIVRHKSVTPVSCDLDEAAFDMETMDYAFHLFTEVGSGQDSVLYRDGETGYRVAQVEPKPEALAPHTLPVTVSAHRAPLLSTTEAVARMATWDRPFLFFLDGERGQGAVLYHRYDGHYGLIAPAEPSRGGEVAP